MMAPEGDMTNSCSRLGSSAHVATVAEPTGWFRLPLPTGFCRQPPDWRLRICAEEQSGASACVLADFNALKPKEGELRMTEEEGQRENYRGEVRDNLFLEGGKNSVLLLEGSHAMPARPSGEAILV
jgi:hypothetical protein